MRGKLFFAANRWQPSAHRISAPRPVTPVPEAGARRRTLRAMWRRNEVTGQLEMRWELMDEPSSRKPARWPVLAA
jgi:hypothetical protein